MTITTAKPNPTVAGLIAIGAPLLAIAVISLSNHIVVGEPRTVWATILAGVVVPTFGRVVGAPFLALCDVKYPSVSAYAFYAVCNFGIGAASAFLFLAQT